MLSALSISRHLRSNRSIFCNRHGARYYSSMKRELIACHRLLNRSGLNSIPKLERLLGANHIQTSAKYFQKDDNNDKKYDKNGDDRERMLSALKTAVGFFLVPILLILTFGGGGSSSRSTEQFQDSNNRPPNERGQGNSTDISWNSFYYNLLLKGEVKEIIIHSGVNRATAILHPGAVYKGQKLHTQVVNIKAQNVEDIEEKIREAELTMGISGGQGIPVRYERNSENLARMISVGFLVFLGFLFFRAMRGTRISMGDMNPFQTMSKADFTLIDPLNKKGKGVKFRDVAGLKEPKIELMEFVDILKNPERYLDLGAKPPKGALLLGPPGCGKTMLAKAVANEANVPFLSMAGSEFIEMIGGLGASRVRNLFSEAKKRAPAIIFIDEIDAIGRQRNMGSAGPMDGGEGDQTLNQLLVEMDGMGSAANVILLASTNRAEVLDKALLRPGRFDRHISIDLPTLIERKEIFEQHMSSVILEEDKSTYSQRLATLTPGFSGADIANVVNEAALHAARELKDRVGKKNLEYAIERVIAGPEKKTGILNVHEKNIVAYHESGHALVGWMLEHTDALLKVTILPRTSQALGFAQYTPQDKKLFSPEEMMDRMCMALGGRVAESLTFNRITTGAQNDLEKVTKMAYSQIRNFGFNSTVGEVSFELTGAKKPYSKKLAATMDLEARNLIADAYKKTEDILRENQDKLELLAKLLIKKETLSYQDVEDLLGPPPFGKKHLVTPIDYENQLKEQSKLGDEGQQI